MWLKVTIVGLKAAPGHKPKAAYAFCSYSINDPPPGIPDQSLAAFCLPLGPENQTLKEFMAPEEFSFTLTHGDGSRVQGFCRRFLPPAPRLGSKMRYPQVLCLVCEACWPSFFYKVLEVTEQLLRSSDLLADFSNKQLPASSDAGMFLANLGQVLAAQPQLGSVVRVQLPQLSMPLPMSPPKRVGGTNTEGPLPLLLTEEFMELQVPPDCGNGAANAGVSLARLLWHVPVPAMLTLIASLLLERRVLVVGQSRDMVSAAVNAAQALLHPFRWHHIFLPLLPRSLADYLTAPMPFLIGMPAQLLPALKHLPMDEVTLIDLDLAKCEPGSGSARDDANLLPWREQLEGALAAACSLLKSPTEMESNPVIASIMHGYFLKLLGGYRSHIYPEGVMPGSTAGGLAHRPVSGSSPALAGAAGGLPSGFNHIAGLVSPTNPPGASNGSSARLGGSAGGGFHQRSRSDAPLHSSTALSSFGSGPDAVLREGVTGGLQEQQPQQGGRLGRLSFGPSSGGDPAGGGGGSAASSRRQSRISSSSIRLDDGLKGHGYWFDHQGLAASHKRNDKARHFLGLMRHSQMFEVFVRERLEMCANVEGGPECSGDVFEMLVNTYLDGRSRRLAARLGAGVRTSLSRFGALLKGGRHRRTDSNQGIPGPPSLSYSLPGGGPGATSSSGGALFDGTSSSGSINGSFAAGLMSSMRARGGAMADSPQAARMRQLVASFAAAAEQVRRNLAVTDSSGRGMAGAGHQATSPSSASAAAALDPSAFFEDGEEELEAEAAEAAAAAAAAGGSNGSGRLSRNSLSSSSLKDLASAAGGGAGGLGAAALVAPSGASWTAGATGSSKVGAMLTQQQLGPLHSGLAGLISSSGSALPRQPGSSVQAGPAAVAEVAAAGPHSGSSSTSSGLQRHSVPAVMTRHGQQQQEARPASPSPLIDFSSDSSSHSNRSSVDVPGVSVAVAGGITINCHGSSNPADSVVPRQQQPHVQQQQPAQVPHGYLEQLQQHPQQQWQVQPRQMLHSPRSPSGLGQGSRATTAFGSSGGGGGFRGSSGGGSHPHRINVQEALAAYAPGPLPQPPQAKGRAVMGGAGPGAGLGIPRSPKRQQVGSMQQQQQQQQQSTNMQAPHLAPTTQQQSQQQVAAGAAANISATDAADAAALAAWDPFAELLTERMASFNGVPAAGQQQELQQQQFSQHQAHHPAAAVLMLQRHHDGVCSTSSSSAGGSVSDPVLSLAGAVGGGTSTSSDSDRVSSSGGSRGSGAGSSVEFNTSKSVQAFSFMSAGVPPEACAVAGQGHTALAAAWSHGGAGDDLL